MESCPSCGNDSPTNSLHCVHCGAKLVSAAQKTQFGMPALRPMALPSAPAADATPDDAPNDGSQSTEEFEPQDLARLAMATRKTPGNALSGLGGLKGGRRPGSLLQGLPKFRGVGQSPLTSGEFKLGSIGGGSSGLSGVGKGSGGWGASSLGKSGLGKGSLGSPMNPAPGASENDAALGLYSAAKRSSLPPEAAPESSVPPTEATPATATDDIPAEAPTMAMQGVSESDLADNGAPADDAVQAVDKTGEVGPTMVLQGVAGADLDAAGANILMTAEERLVAQIPHDSSPLVTSAAIPSAVSAAANATASATPVAASPIAAAAAAAAAAKTATTEPPLPTAMRGSERAHHPGGRGVTHARVEESGGNAKWIVIGVLVLAAVGVAIWFATR